VNTVVVGFDGSDESRDALALGAAVVQAFDADLVVAVVDEIHPFAWNFPKADERAAYLQTTLDQAAEQLGAQEFNAETLRGSVPECLEVLASNIAADLLVVGSTSLGELGRVFTGSVGDRLLAGAPCAVAIVPRGYADGAKSAPMRIGVGYDGEPEARVALSLAKEFAGLDGGALRLIAIVPTFEELIPGRISNTAPAYAAFVRNHLTAELEKAKAACMPAGDVTEVLIEGVADRVLVEQSEELDLLVLGSRGYGPIRRVFLGGVASKVIRSAACPVVITPRSAVASRREAHETDAGNVN